MGALRIASALIALALGGCGLVTSDPAGGPGGAGGSRATHRGGRAAASGVGGSGAAASGGGGSFSGGCTLSPPNFGAPCNNEGAICGFGAPCEEWHCSGGAFIKVDACAGPSKQCGATGAVCENYGWSCSCGINGEWSCEGGGEDIPDPWESLPAQYDLQGKPCKENGFSCLPQGTCGPMCSCQNGKWACFDSDQVCIDPPCPEQVPYDQGCPVLGQKCQYSGFCAPTCSCVYSESQTPEEGLVPKWACLSPPC